VHACSQRIADGKSLLRGPSRRQLYDRSYWAWQSDSKHFHRNHHVEFQLIFRKPRFLSGWSWVSQELRDILELRYFDSNDSFYIHILVDDENEGFSG
jgi:hypothetical protein